MFEASCPPEGEGNIYSPHRWGDASSSPLARPSIVFSSAPTSPSNASPTSPAVVVPRRFQARGAQWTCRIVSLNPPAIISPYWLRRLLGRLERFPILP